MSLRLSGIIVGLLSVAIARMPIVDSLDQRGARKSAISNLRTATVDTIPCTSGMRRLRPDDTTTAAALTRLAVQMRALADSANKLANRSTEEDADATPEFFASAGEVARRATLLAPDYLASVIVATHNTDRSAILGEGLIDTTLAKQAECYAKRALDLTNRQGDQAAITTARKVLEGIELNLQDARQRRRH